MSNTQNEALEECECTVPCDTIRMVLHPRDKDLGGFSVRRSLPTHQAKMIGPWIFFDHMGPAQFEPGDGINVRPHPHIGIATVTYLFEGEILHRDSLGSVQAIRPGDINLMVAGKGIVHSERESEKRKAFPRTLNALQLWIALPTEHEEISPAFYHYPSDEIPTTEINGVSVRVMMGDAYDLHSPVMTFSKTLYAEAQLKTGHTIELPNAQELGVYVVEGSLQAKATELPTHSMTILDNPKGVVVEAKEPTRIAIIGGNALGKRYIDWNFVSSDKERIELAKTDWKMDRFPRVPGDDESIPLPK